MYVSVFIEKDMVNFKVKYVIPFTYTSHDLYVNSFTHTHTHIKTVKYQT